jgi:hypothetical protein
VIKTAVVTLRHPPGPAILSDSEHLRLAIEAHAGRRPVTAGAVEVAIDGASVATAPVVRGVARPTVALQRTTPAPKRLIIRYLPGAPWWLGGNDLELTVTLKPPSLWRQVPWVIAAALLALWMGRGWWPPRSPRRQKPTRRVAQAWGRPLLELVERAPGASGWTGLVVDAHDQFPLAGASLRIRSPSFVSDAGTAGTVTDSQGTFCLNGAELHSVEGATLEVRAPSYAELRRPLPPPGTLRIALVSRRRALLDDLVRWARRRGHPWWVPAEPTPAHVAHEAEAQRAPETARWARAVQEAAFGPDPPSERTERALSAPSRVPEAPGSPQGRRGREMPPGAG